MFRGVMDRWIVTLDKDGTYHCARLGQGTTYEADLEWVAIEAKRANTQETWLVDAPTRYQALKMARGDKESRPTVLMLVGRSN